MARPTRVPTGAALGMLLEAEVLDDLAGIQVG